MTNMQGAAGAGAIRAGVAAPRSSASAAGIGALPRASSPGTSTANAPRATGSQGAAQSPSRPVPVTASSGEPGDERLDKHAEEWLQLLRAALPSAVEEVAAARAQAAAAVAAAQAAEELKARRLSPKVPATGSSEGTNGQSSARGPVASLSASKDQEQAGTGAGADNSGLSTGVSFLLTSFDRLFSDQHDKEAVPQQRGGRYRVVVPADYPGVQFRRSRDLTDRYDKYAPNGTVVRGEVSEDGEWLKLSDTLFLPMRIGGKKLLEPEAKKSFWFACGQGNIEEDEEVLKNIDNPTLQTN